ncbi:thioredoxin-like domain-containing protein [Tenuifilum sp.]|uniref:thioredoxin-like domain-containing protein n=1 Tax=Tenuifilum sp. TaxID=2760880 RepID=UPI001B7874BA|nr:redoxin domain-containing protein [Bacteroidales bacterium]HOK60663.1 thioredoxin-like domain-containing protein [Tenuifilum sp.]MBP9028539.1 redoxin domain-containing protein [Bacteroidales bacterium]HOK86226.1 thioredoxin-like domain-containing protein [Tenuifilum sp.]HON69678.1 thioredoxin-like domain-containing protein [Tenuifilum sp.]
MKKFFLITLTLSLMVFASAFAQKNGYRIEVKIDGLTQGDLLLGYHFGDKKYVKDTATVNSKGFAVFEGDTLLPGGIYLVILPEKNYFEVLVDKNQKFSVATSKDNLLENLKFTNSSENEGFIKYQRFMIDMQKQSKELSEQLKESLSDSLKANAIRDKMNELNNKVLAYWDEVEANYKGTLLAAIIKAMRNVEAPKHNIAKDTPKYDSLVWAHNYNYNRYHFFDNIDFSDARLLRTPILESKINVYFDRVLLPMPDSIIPAAIELIEKAKANKEMFQYILSTLTNKFQTSERMGMDGVFVAVAEKYYLGGQAWWADQKLLDKIAERVKAIKPNIIGNIAPDLWLPNPNGKYYRLSDVNAKVTVAYFWDPDCSHCKKVTPELKKVYEKYKGKGFEVFAVYTQGDQPKWMEYIKANELTWINVWDPTFSSNFRNLYDIYATPVIYVLDKNKKILAKRISVETLEKILEEELK